MAASLLVSHTSNADAQSATMQSCFQDAVAKYLSRQPALLAKILREAEVHRKTFAQKIAAKIKATANKKHPTEEDIGNARDNFVGLNDFAANRKKSDALLAQLQQQMAQTNGFAALPMGDYSAILTPVIHASANEVTFTYPKDVPAIDSETGQAKILRTTGSQTFSFDANLMRMFKAANEEAMPTILSLERALVACRTATPDALAKN